MRRSLLALSGLTLVATLAPSIVGCGGGGDSGGEQGREEGQTEFQSAPPIGQAGGQFGGGRGEASGAAPAADTNSKGVNDPSSLGRHLQETDIYRVEGNRLYYLNGYRGLMVFDVTNVDQPKLLGRSPIYGTPVEMFVRNGIATVVIGDWYGNGADGAPFHGSIVRGIDATDPTQMKITGEAQVKGWARDMRVVESINATNLYIVSEDYGWYYGYWADYGMGGGMGGDARGAGAPASDAMYGYGGASKVVVSSLAIAGGNVSLRGSKEYDGYSGAFNVQAYSILLAHDVVDPANKQPTGKAALEYIDISDPGGAIQPKGSVQVNGLLQGWSADNGRWNIDFDGKKASVLTCAASQYGYCSGQSGYNLSTVDFTNAQAPAKLAELPIASTGWAATARFSYGRMYLSPREGYWQNNGQSPQTPIQVYDLSDMASPKLSGQTTITGAVWMFLPSASDRIFALGNDYGPNSSSSDVTLRYLDVGDPTNPKVIGTSRFGNGWAWTPAAGTFKAFTRDDKQKLAVVPFSGWSSQAYEYTNGVQLVEFDQNSITTRGAAKGKGWVERGIFVNGRLLSLSDQALTVVDYSNRDNPKVVTEMTLARNVVSAEPQGATIAQLSTDWWGNDTQTSELRVLPIANAEERFTDNATKTAQIAGTNARVFRNGDLAYVVTMKYPKPNNAGGSYEGPTPHVQVVDLANGGAVLKGAVDLPADSNYYWSWWGGCYYWDWYDGSGIVQVEKNALAFRKVHGQYDPNTQKYTTETKLYVVDLANADAPQLASALVTPDTDSWWGNMRVVGDTLYTTHYEWVKKPKPATSPNESYSQYTVKYYLDQVDLSNRASPKVGKRINVPGILVGASEVDPSLLYFVDYRWYGDSAHDELSVAQIKNDKAYFRSATQLDGYVGQVFVRGSKAYMSAEEYVKNPDPNQPGKSFVQLHEIDLADPAHPTHRKSQPKEGWGWLVDVEGDRAIITSGWGQVGLDIYKLAPNGPPTYDQFARTRGWWTNAISRQGNDLYLSSGYWGVQKISLK